MADHGDDKGETDHLLPGKYDELCRGANNANTLAPLLGAWADDNGIARRIHAHAQVVWITLFAATAAAFSWWVPDVFLGGVNVSAMVCNMLGAVIVAATTTFQQVRFQSPQTYSVYKGVKFGLCAVLTNFSILIEDSERLLHTMWWLSPANLILNVGLAMVAYQAGRLLALRVKAGTQFSMALLLMENEDKRMKVEIEAQEAIEVANQGEGAWESQIISHMRRGRQLQQERARSWLPLRHILLLVVLVTLPVVNCFILTRRDDSSSRLDKADLQYDYSLSVMMSVAGALAAKYYGTQKVKRTDVQWRTFRVNMASCILIATAHNVLFFRTFFPSLSDESVILFLKRFVQCFCGSLSSFAELIDETVVLVNSRSCPREVVLRNIFYNLLLCLAVFFFIVYLASGIVSLIWTIPL